MSRAEANVSVIHQT